VCHGVHLTLRLDVSFVQLQHGSCIHLSLRNTWSSGATFNLNQLRAREEGQAEHHNQVLYCG
jgi:hypothetical protein